MSSAAQPDSVPTPAHVCSTLVHVCSCGRRWEYRVSGHGEPARYTSAIVIARYELLYGPHPTAVLMSGGGAS